jgi:hypothetical protein
MQLSKKYFTSSLVGERPCQPAARDSGGKKPRFELDRVTDCADRHLEEA